MPKKLPLLEQVSEVPDATYQIPIGVSKDGQPSPFRADLTDVVERGFENLRKMLAFSGVVGDLRTYSVNGTNMAISYPSGLIGQSAIATFTNSGDAQVDLGFYMVKSQKGLVELTQGRLRLSPGSSRKIGPHTGFEAITPSGSPSFIDVELSLYD